MRFGVKVITALLLVLSLGLHWAALQMVAWTGMLIAYSQESGVREAVAKTFDGQHPCPLCHAIAKGRAEERQQDQKPVKPGGKLEPVPVWTPLTFHFPRPGAMTTGDTPVPRQRSEAPPKPRPRPVTA